MHTLLENFCNKFLNVSLLVNSYFLSTTKFGIKYIFLQLPLLYFTIWPICTIIIQIVAQLLVEPSLFYTPFGCSIYNASQSLYVSIHKVTAALLPVLNQFKLQHFIACVPYIFLIFHTYFNIYCIQHCPTLNKEYIETLYIKHGLIWHLEKKKYLWNIKKNKILARMLDVLKDVITTFCSFFLALFFFSRYCSP